MQRARRPSTETVNQGTPQFGLQIDVKKNMCMKCRQILETNSKCSPKVTRNNSIFSLRVPKAILNIPPFLCDLMADEFFLLQVPGWVSKLLDR